MPKFPKILYRDKSDIKIYDKLKKEVVFSDCTNKELFLTAIASGYRCRVRKKLKNRDSSGFVRSEYLKPIDWTFIKMIAMSDESENILNKPDTICQICEEYAHGGIQVLNEELLKTQIGTFEKNFELNVFELYEDLVSEID